MIAEAWRATPCGKLRARGLGLPFEGQPGLHNAITDVASVEVGYCTLVSGEGKLVAGKGPIRTGVTAILPRGRAGGRAPCAAGSYSFNGNGEMTGLLWVEESGELQTPITITNTHSCGTARDATIEWMISGGIGAGQDWSLPVAAETYDGDLNDINGFHVKRKHVFAALDAAKGGAIELGSVGGGTGMICYDFKGGSGSASRMVKAAGREYVVGAFVQSNFGRRPEMMILGVAAGKAMPGNELRGKSSGSIIVVIATDAPLLAHQLKRLARRVPVGLARTGAIGHNGSGDIFLAFSTANEDAFGSATARRQMEFIRNDELDMLFEGVVQSVEEAVIDSMIANETMTGIDGRTAVALPHGQLVRVLSEAGLKLS